MGQSTPIAHNRASADLQARVGQWLGAALLAGLSAYAFWPNLVALFQVWSDNPQYSHGFLVPAFSAYLLWARRGAYPQPLKPAPLLGGLALVLSLGLHTFAGFRFHDWPEQISLVPFLFALALCCGGWKLAKWALPAIAFLAFMVPLPYRVEVALGAPLQSLATTCATFVLQTLGQPAVSQGNLILLREVQLNIVEACSGLKMLVTFVTFASAVCLLVDRPLADKLVILVSSVPIAIAVNVMRIVVTGFLYLHVSGETGKAFTHDAAGWFMMPLALACLGVELWIMKRLIVDLPKRAAARR